MSFDFEIFPAQRLILARYRGGMTLGELRESAERLWSDSRYSMAYDGIVDISDEGLNISIEDFRGLVGFLTAEDRTSRGRWAAVASSPLATAYGLLYQRALSPRHSLSVHSTWEAACAALHLNPTPAMEAWAARGAGSAPAV
ncbi:MAG TPA: hypothetical protein VHC86_05305 [Opitutaceae bacterium]|nr:hypothetical protein [Opitutaceae bacterium]